MDGTLTDLEASLAGRTRITPAEFDQLVEWLGRNDPDRRRLAADTLARLGGRAVPRLVAVVTTPGLAVDHAVALLGVLERIRQPVPAQPMFALYLLVLTTPSVRLREKITDTLAALRPQELDAPAPPARTP